MSTFDNENHCDNSNIICGYRIGEPLGEGAFCSVFKGTHLATGMQVAIKVLTPSTPNALKNFETEIACMGRLDHPYIAKIHDVIYETIDERGCIHYSQHATNPRKVYAVTEYLQGGDLFQLILEKEWLTEDEARHLFRQLVSAIEYCHANLIVHRDIKPENILLDGDGNAKLTDFGLSNTIIPGLPFSTFCGSPGYASPEIVYNKKYNGPEVDIWSLGVVLYAMLTGRIPWKMQEEVSEKTERAFKKGKFHFPSCIPLSDAAKSLVKSMLVVDPKKRATLEEIRTHRWTNYGEDYPERYFKAYPPVLKINDTALRLLSHLGYKQKTIKKRLIENEPCPILLERLSNKPLNISLSSPSFRKSLPSQWTIAMSGEIEPQVLSPAFPNATIISTSSSPTARTPLSPASPPTPLSLSSSGVRGADFLTRLMELTDRRRSSSTPPAVDTFNLVVEKEGIADRILRSYKKRFGSTTHQPHLSLLMEVSH